MAEVQGEAEGSQAAPTLHFKWTFTLEQNREPVGTGC